MILKCTAQPGSEPITLTDVQGQCRIADLSAEESTINLFIKAIRQRAEAITRRALITQSWRLTLDAFPEYIKLYLPPLQTVDSITYVDINGDTQTLSSTLYRVNTDKEPAKVYPAYGQSWPATLNDINTVTVEFTCGYGPTEPDAADNVPECIKLWMLMQVAGHYENREAFMEMVRGQLVELKSVCDGLLDDLRIYGW